MRPKVGSVSCDQTVSCDSGPRGPSGRKTVGGCEEQVRRVLSIKETLCNVES